VPVVSNVRRSTWRNVGASCRITRQGLVNLQQRFLMLNTHLLLDHERVGREDWLGVN